MFVPVKAIKTHTRASIISSEYKKFGAGLKKMTIAPVIGTQICPKWSKKLIFKLRLVAKMSASSLQKK